MRKLIPGNYNVICKGKSGQLIESSPEPGRSLGGKPLIGIIHVMGNQPTGMAIDGGYIYFSTRWKWKTGNVELTEWRLYKYSIIGGERIWSVKISPIVCRVHEGDIFILGNYIYFQRTHTGGIPYVQRYSKIDGSKYGSELTIEPPGTVDFGGNNYFVDGNYLYVWSTGHTAFIKKFDSNLNQVSSVELLAPAGTPITWEFPTFFILGWNGSKICGGGRWEYDGGDWGKGAFATWSLSGGVPTGTWICTNPYGQEMTPVSGCSGNNVIIGNEIWSFGEMHDGERVYNPDNGRYYLVINPEKNAMYYNSDWRQTCIHWPYLHSSTSGDYDFYKYGNFYRGHYGVTSDTPNAITRAIASNGKFYYIFNNWGWYYYNKDPLVGVNEMTSGGAYQNIHIV